MNVLEKRFAGILAQGKPLARKMSKEQVIDIVHDVFQLGWEEPYPPKPFRYRCANHLVLNMRPEVRGSNQYWFANKQIDGQRFHVYVAPVGLLTRELLENVGKHISG